ncbi:MAG: DUF1254 domain-containing protein [Hyphomicrobiales bacterium]
MPQITAQEARVLAEEAYTYGFAIVENHKAIFGMCVYKDSPQYSGFNNYLHGRRLFDPDYDVVVTPNNDTLYSTTFADLRTEPLVLSVPPTGDRYQVIQLVDMGTDNFAYIGTRVTGVNGGDFLLIGPTFKGTLPVDRFTSVISCPSQFIALATRTAIDGPDDLEEVVKIQDAMAITPMSTFLGSPAPETASEISFPPFTPELHGSTKLLEYLGFFLQWHTPPLFEHELLRRLAQINVGANLTFDFNAFPGDVQKAIADGLAAAHQKIEERGNNLGEVIDGWEYTPPMGDYGNNYLFRSAVAWKFMYTNSPEEALYPIANTDVEGNQLTGKKDYVLHFPAGQLPPVNAFWSITMYFADTRLMVHNEIARYSIGDRTDGLKYGEDGSLKLYIQHEAPEAEKASNWLPAPDREFYLVARTYMPKEPLLDGTYHLPPVTRT